MGIVFKNNAKTTLASSLSNSATSATVTDGSVFPSLSAGEFFQITFDDGSNNEICKCTARSGNTLTIVRAQESTTARAFSSGDAAELRLTAGVLETIQENIAAKSANQTVFNATTSGGATSYDIGIDPGVEANAMVFLDGVMQHHDTFSFSSNTLTFDAAPVNGTKLEVIVDNLINLQSSNLTVDSFTAADASGSPQTDFVLSDTPAAETNLIVFVDGVFQDQDAYTISSNTLTITTGVIAGRGVTVYVINPVNIGTPSDSTVTSAKLSGDITMPGGLIVGSNDVAFDSPTFFVDHTNSRVGLGTSSPSVPVDIVGDVKMSANLTVDTSTLVVDSSNNRVGIGTTSPGHKLSFGNFIPSDGKTITVYEQGNIASGIGVVSGEYRNFTNTSATMSFGQYSESDGTTYTENLEIEANGVLSAKKSLQITGTATPGAGTGIEIHNSGSDNHIYAYDRDSSAVMNLSLQNPGGLVGIGTTAFPTWSGQGIKAGTRSMFGELNVNKGSYMTNNLAYDGSNWKYIVADEGSLFANDPADNHAWSWWYASSGSAGANAGITKYMQLSRTGELSLLRANGNVGAPDTSDHSQGTRIHFYDASTTVWYAMGIESNNLWFNADEGAFKFYSKAVQKVHFDSSEPMPRIRVGPSATNAMRLGTVTAVFPYSGLSLIVANPGTALTVHTGTNTTSSWVNLHSSLNDYLRGTATFNTINTSQQANIIVYLNVATKVYMARQASWNTVSTSGWTQISSSSTIINDNASHNVYVKYLEPGTHSLDNDSALYFFEAPIGP